MSSKYEELIKYVKQTEALSHASGLIAWDQETKMPKGSVEQRADTLSVLESEIHKRKSNKYIEELISHIKKDDLSKIEKSNLDHIKKSFNRASKIPNDLATKISKICSLSQMSWVEANQTKELKTFLNYFKEVINLKREEARLLSSSNNIYDALIDDFEPEMNTEKFDKIFANLRKNLIEIRNSIFENKKPVNELSFNFDKNLQLELAKELANIFGYDFNIGRMDLSQHPFSTGNGNDVRITTRVDEKDPFNCLYSTIHETGHAVYEQKIPKEFIFTPNGNGVSMGVHESQSRIFENQFGRSKEFCSFLFKLMYDKFGNFGINDENNFYIFINNVENSFIRTEADEVNYNLHILMRYDLEKELFSENLKVDDLEEAWNARFKNDFGLTVSTPTEGFLQDVHWSAGLFGYFPTYTLGNIYAGCLYEKILNDNKDIMHEVKKGKFKEIITWLTKNIYNYGSSEKPDKIISQAINKEVSDLPLINYLKNKFDNIYN